MTLRIYVWEGHGISAAYHDDGTLVVLAESPEQAREVIRTGQAARAARYAEFERVRDAYLASIGGFRKSWWTDPEWLAIQPSGAFSGFASDYFDGTDTALDREPDRVIEIDGPKWVAFNGGGYD